MGPWRQWAQGDGDHSDDVKILFADDCSLVRLRGEVDLARRTQLEQVADLAVEYGHPVRVDVSEVTFIDSTGLAFLAHLAAAGNAAGWKPALLGANRTVLETISIGGLLPVLDLTDFA